MLIVLPVFIKGFYKAQSFTTKRRPLDLPCSWSYSKISEKKLALKFLNLDVIDENDNPAQIDFQATNNQKSSNVKKGVLCGLILRFLYSVHLIRKKIRLLFIGFRQSNDNDFCKNQSHLHLFALSYSLCKSLEL